MTVTARAAAPPRPRSVPAAQAVPPAPPVPAPRRRQVALTPMRQETAKRMRKLAASVQESHPDMSVHDHLRDAAKTLESGNEEASQRHLRAAMFALTPQSLMRNGLHTDDHHQAARQVMHGVHRQLLLVKDITDAAAKNQANLRRDSYGDDATSNPPPASPVHADPNAGYGPGALAQKPAARQPPGNQALSAPNRAGTGKPDPNVADPAGPQPRGSKQFAYGWSDLALVIELATRPKVVADLTGDGHGHHIPGTPDVYRHGFIPIDGTVLHSDGVRRPAGAKGPEAVKSASPSKAASKVATAKPAPAKAEAAAVKGAPAVKAAPKVAAAPSQAPAVEREAAPGSGAKMTADEAAAAAAADNAEKQAEGISMLGQMGGKSTQLAVIKKRSLGELQAADYGFQQRAAEKGHPDKVMVAHQMVRDEIAKRGGKLADLTAPVRTQSAAEVAQREKKALIVAWSSSYRYKGTSEVANNKRISDFATEMHRLLSTNKQPAKCGPGCQDAHKFLSMVDQEAKPQDKELQRGLTLSPAAAERMFKPGKTMDMPTGSWTADPEVGASYAKGEGAPGKVKVLIHAAPGAKGMDISALSNWHASEKGTGGENEVVTGGRFNVQKVETTGGVMNVYVTQQAFSAN